VITDASAIPEAVAPMRTTLERTRAVGRQLVGLELPSEGFASMAIDVG
jgi:hypothetical protein